MRSGLNDFLVKGGSRYDIKEFLVGVFFFVEKGSFGNRGVFQWMNEMDERNG